MVDAVSPSHSYRWPDAPLRQQGGWRQRGDWLERLMPETASEVARDSRWPAFFPSAICHVTTGAGETTALEKIVGATVVNRFPYVLALSLCREDLSARHYARRVFMATLESSQEAAVQFLEPGTAHDACAFAVSSTPDTANNRRVKLTGLPVRHGLSVQAPVFQPAYLVYEGRLVRPGRDLEGAEIYRRPWIDVGSHRIYFLEITAIQLRSDIADGRTQIRWRSLPHWTAHRQGHDAVTRRDAIRPTPRYQKPYTDDYRFPSSGTRAFEEDGDADGMKYALLPTSTGPRIELDNDRARWPCFFPSSVGMITSRSESGTPNLMPCGSTTVVSRHPMTLAVAMSYAAVNERYNRRGSLEAIRRSRFFGCGVPFADERILEAIRYAGNISIDQDPDKILNAGLEVLPGDGVPRLRELPIHFDCELVGEERLGTHVLLLGRVVRIFVHTGVSVDSPLTWYPAATLASPLEP